MEASKGSLPAAMELQFQNPNYSVGKMPPADSPSQDLLPRRRVLRPAEAAAASVAVSVDRDWRLG